MTSSPDSFGNLLKVIYDSPEPVSGNFGSAAGPACYTIGNQIGASCTSSPRRRPGTKTGRMRYVLALYGRQQWVAEFCFGCWACRSRSLFSLPWCGIDMLTSPAAPPGYNTDVPVESSVSAVSWRAILGGAIAATSSSIVLLALGAGLGFSAISPWPNSGASAATFTIVAGIWLIVVQWLSAGIGGYLTGRLRTKWVSVHNHEVFFRDTAHGLLTWAVATLIGAFVLASAVSSAIGTGTQAAATVASGVAQGAGTAASGARAYDVDTLFRGQKPEFAASSEQSRAETTRTLASRMANGDLPAGDRTYLAQQIATRTGISEADAQKRVDDVVAKEKAAATKAREVADAARKSASYISIFTALSMLIGAFIASAAAAYGGSLRDEHP